MTETMYPGDGADKGRSTRAGESRIVRPVSVEILRNVMFDRTGLEYAAFKYRRYKV